MKELSISKLVENLTRTDNEIRPPDPLGLREKLEAALTAIALTEKGSDQPRLQQQFIGDAIYLGHLTALSSYDYNKYLDGSAELLISLGQLSRFTSKHRLKVTLFGLVANLTLLPVTFQTKSEATSCSETFQSNGTSLIHVVPVELSSALVDSRAQPEAPEAVSEPPPDVTEPRQVKMLDEELTAASEAPAANPGKLIPPQEEQT